MSQLKTDETTFIFPKDDKKVLASSSNFLVGQEGENIKSYFRKSFGLLPEELFVFRKGNVWAVLAPNKDDKFFSLYIPVGERWEPIQHKMLRSDVVH